MNNRVTIKFDSFRTIIVLVFIAPISSGVTRKGLFLLITLLCTWKVMLNLKSEQYKIPKTRGSLDSAILYFVLMMIAYSLLNVVYNESTLDGIERLIQLFASVMILLTAKNHKWNQSDKNFIVKVVYFIVMLSIAMWPMSGFKMNYYAGPFSRGNSLAPAIFCDMVIIFVLRPKFERFDKLMICMMFFLLYVANSRSTQLATVVFLCLMVMLMKSRGRNFEKLFYIEMLVILIIPFGYMLLYNSPLKNTLNDISWILFRKRFFSGRQQLWGALISLIAQKPFWGYGFDMTPEILLGGVWSAHNWYLQILIQTGVIGLSIIINLIRSVLKSFCAMRERREGRIGVAFLLSVMLWQSFEVALTQNNFSIGIMIWLVWGMILGICKAPKTGYLVSGQ